MIVSWRFMILLRKILCYHLASKLSWGNILFLFLFIFLFMGYEERATLAGENRFHTVSSETMSNNLDSPIDSSEFEQQSDRVPSVLRWWHYALVFASNLLLWLLLTGTLNSQELLVGSVVSLAITLLFGRRLEIFSGFRFSVMAPFYILSYLGNFLVALVRANFDLAGRVLSPSLPIHPELVEVKTRLQSPLAKLLLANTITLTPGTLTVDVEGDTLLVHWVNCPPGMNTEKATAQIAGDFEQHISRFLK